MTGILDLYLYSLWLFKVCSIGAQYLLGPGERSLLPLLFVLVLLQAEENDALIINHAVSNLFNSREKLAPYSLI